ncbi:hypothetical protein J8L98_12825 [Pseudoalteromonas sp. MMG013]|uniref:DUF6326 family protein n=1 Tax=Pseudoalteromonas sp. MMG013 TaxID=2822687 RepID=UPI001B395143|nr:DUF6326 family protein [Pseudoalteromonas sp. MMG013]MBQ4862572.1 hypothetical protein [Pseudoalteromonas sp. MMG013]
MSVMNSTESKFEDFKINVKLKISALWIAVMFCYVYGDYIQIYVPGIMAKAMAVNSSIETQLQFLAVAVLMVVPSVMVFFTLVLKPTINRRVNIIVSMFFILMLVATNLTEIWWFYLFLTAVEVAISVAIVLYAWHWPKTRKAE